MQNKIGNKLFAAAIILMAAGSSELPAASLVWSGLGTPATNWDVGITANWRNGPSGSIFNNGDSATFNDNGITTNIFLATNVLPAGITVDAATHNYIFTGTNAITGSGLLFKANTGTLTINSTNTFTGGLVISNGTVTLGNASAAGSGTITLAGGTLNLGTTVAPGNTLSNIANSTITGGSAGGQVGISKVTGSNTLNITITTGVFDFRGDMTTFSGTVAFGTSANNVRLNGTTGSSLANFDLGSGTLLMSIRNGATAIALGGLTGGSNTVLSGNSAGANAATFTIGGNNVSTTFNGKIVNGTGTTAINKAGTGTLTLAGTNTFTGATTVSSGTLTLTNSATLTNSSAIAVNSGATLNLAGTAPFNELDIYTNKTLKGGGVINASAVVVASGATVLPGDGVGVLTVNGPITLGGGLLMELNNSLVTITNDRITAPTINFGGTLNVTNIGPPLVVGQSFQLFSGTRNGTFAAINLPTNGPNNLAYTWTNKLTVDGSIQVLTVTGGVNTNPPPLQSTLIGTTLTLSWPTNVGWTLQQQTNSLTTGLGTNWVDVPGSTSITSTNITVDATKPTVFYRLKL